METSGAMPQPLPPQAIIMHETEIENEVAKISGCKMCFFKHSLKFSRSILKHVRRPHFMVWAICIIQTLQH
jgi:hypothetical protein